MFIKKDPHDEEFVSESNKRFATKTSTSFSASGHPERVVDAFLTVKDYEGLDRYLCKYKVPIETLTNNLLSACQKPDSEAVQLLCKHGANVNGMCPRRLATVLEDAMSSGDEHIVQALIAHGLVVDEVQIDGMSVLHWACKAGFFQTVK